MNVHFSFLTIFLLLLGWLTHWFVAVNKARAAARAAKTTEPGLWDYWHADPYTTLLSVIGLCVFYFAIPYLADQWPAIATVIGATAENPMNPISAYLGGIVSPYLSDIAGKRVSAMVGDINNKDSTS